METREKGMDAQAAWKRLAAMCAKAEHCSGEAVEKMRRWGVDERAQAEVMARLIEGRYIDDERFCRAFVADKLRYNKWGRMKIERALWAKGAPKEVYSPILAEVTDEEYKAALAPLLEAKARSTRAANRYELSAKLARFAAGRGFDSRIIYGCLDDMELEDG